MSDHWPMTRSYSKFSKILKCSKATQSLSLPGRRRSLSRSCTRTIWGWFAPLLVMRVFVLLFVLKLVYVEIDDGPKEQLLASNC